MNKKDQSPKRSVVVNGPSRTPESASPLQSPERRSPFPSPELKTPLRSPDHVSAHDTSKVKKQSPRPKSRKPSEAKNPAPNHGKTQTVLDIPAHKILDKAPSASSNTERIKRIKRESKTIPSTPTDSQTTSIETPSTFTHSTQKPRLSKTQREDLRYAFGDRVDPESTTTGHGIGKGRGVSKGSIFFIIVVVLSVGIIAYFIIKGKRPGESLAAVTKPSSEQFTCPKTTESIDRLAMKIITDVSSRLNSTKDLAIEWTVLFRLPQSVTEHNDIRSGFVAIVFLSTRYKQMVLFTLEHCARQPQRIFLFPEASSDIVQNRLRLQTWFNENSRFLHDYNCTLEDYNVPSSGKSEPVSTVTVIAKLDLSAPSLRISTCTGNLCTVNYETSAPDLLEDKEDISHVELLLHEGWVGQALIGKDYQMKDYVSVHTICELRK